MLSDGPTDYLEAWDRQRAVHAEVVEGRPGRVLLLEHSPVYTAGKRTEPHERPTDGTPVIEVDRGGKITFHGPGQLVGYPIVRLPDHVLVVDYVRRLEEALIAVCRDLGVTTARVPGRSGVWLQADPADRPPRAQDRGDRHPGEPRRDHARLRAELRRGPLLVRAVRALRDRRRGRDHAVGGARSRRHRRRGAPPRRAAPGRSAGAGRRTNRRPTTSHVQNLDVAPPGTCVSPCSIREADPGLRHAGDRPRPVCRKGVSTKP